MVKLRRKMLAAEILFALPSHPFTVGLLSFRDIEKIFFFIIRVNEKHYSYSKKNN